MGACDIYFVMNDTKSFNDVKEKFEEQQLEDREINGHRDGYSGDFQTVYCVKNHLDKVFNSYNDAMEYCLKISEKWSYVVAVKYLICTNKKSKKLEELEERLKKEVLKLSALKIKAINEVKNRKSKLIGCTSCEGKFKKEYLRSNASCPICHSSLISKTMNKRLEIKNLKKEDIRKKIKEEKSKLLQKNSEKRILVAGLGGC